MHAYIQTIIKMKCFFLSNYKIKDMKLFDINNSSNRINNRHVIYFNIQGKNAATTTAEMKSKLFHLVYSLFIV